MTIKFVEFGVVGYIRGTDAEGAIQKAFNKFTQMYSLDEIVYEVDGTGFSMHDIVGLVYDSFVIEAKSKHVTNVFIRGDIDGKSMLKVLGKIKGFGRVISDIAKLLK